MKHCPFCDEKNNIEIPSGLQIFYDCIMYAHNVIVDFDVRKLKVTIGVQDKTNKVLKKKKKKPRFCEKELSNMKKIFEDYDNLMKEKFNFCIEVYNEEHV